MPLAGPAATLRGRAWRAGRGIPGSRCAPSSGRRAGNQSATLRADGIAQMELQRVDQ
jgi:hypothetical protein